MREVTVCVPAPDSDLADAIWRGSGVVASEVRGSDRLRVDYEGNADLFPTFGARVRRAAERHMWRDRGDEQGFPTSACAYVDPDQVIAVGRYDPERKRVEVTDEETLKGWLAVEEISEEDLAGQ